MTEQTINTTAPANPKQPRSNTPAIKRFNMAEYYNKQFARDVENFRNNGKLRSGYDNLDAITNLYPGLYVIGAISSLGKTTFIHQMCDQMAAAGSHILFFSLEQSALELASKTISRTTAIEKAENALSSLQVRRADLSDPRISSAIKKCSAYSDRITIIECSFRANIDDIAKAINNYIKTYNIKPVVAVDYLQVIQTVSEKRMTTKDSVDYNVQRLKELQTDHQLTMLVISSLNRQGYTTAVDQESFKESGGIEYTADVIWGLQLQCIHEKLFSSPNKLNEKRQRIKEAKREIPRKIELVCLKNRFGISSYTCLFDYYPNYDWFKPDLSKLNIRDMCDNNTDTDGWMTIPKGLEYEIPWDI
ncbi:MAG: hypothetical protein K2N34_10330 [Lachnospiraceae bacterium]|nr:hypothetical protein [Lachnospiraceae bacterium]